MSETVQQTAQASSRGQKRALQGIVRSNKMDKTAVVEVTRRVQHPKYKKYISDRTRYVAHDEQNECQMGDRVEIVSARPVSRSKRWRVSRIVERAVQV